MPVVRVEIPTETREKARKVMARFADGKADHAVEQQVLELVWRQGRTPAGRPVCLGLSNGQPVRLKFDVEVSPETR